MVPEAEADTIMNTQITEFRIEPLRFSDENRVRPNEYRMVIRADVELIRTADAMVLVRNGGVQGKETFELLGDLTTSKRRALPDASDDLAREIVSSVTEAWPDNP